VKHFDFPLLTDLGIYGIILGALLKAWQKTSGLGFIEQETTVTWQRLCSARGITLRPQFTSVIIPAIGRGHGEPKLNACFFHG